MESLPRAVSRSTSGVFGAANLDAIQAVGERAHLADSLGDIAALRGVLQRVTNIAHRFEAESGALTLGPARDRAQGVIVAAFERGSQSIDIAPFALEEVSTHRRDFR